MSLFRSSSVIAALTMLSRLFGFLRDILLARVLGASAIADIWQLAFQLPNIFRRLFAEGAFSAAFVPLVNRYFHAPAPNNTANIVNKEANGGNISAHGQAAAEQFAREVLAALILALLFFVAIIEILMPFILYMIDDFGTGGRVNNFSIQLSRITFTYIFFISITTFLAGILNSLTRFTAAAAAPILLNLCLIGAMLYGALLSNNGEGKEREIALLLGYAAALAGLLQMLWLLFWTKRAGFKLFLIRPRFTKGVRDLLFLAGPAVFGAGVYQINRFMDIFFLGRMAEGSFVHLSLADRLNQLPLGVIGIALSTAILPALSQMWNHNDRKGAQALQEQAIELAMLFTIPASFAIFICASPFVNAFFVGGKFTIHAGLTTALTLQALIIGLPAYVLVKILIPSFFARKDTKTPVITASLSLIITLILNLMLIPRYGVAGLAMASAVGAWANLIMLYTILHRENSFHFTGALLLRLLKLAAASMLMAGILFTIRDYGTPFYTGTFFERVLSIAALVITGGIVYALTTFILGATSPARLKILWKRKSGAEMGA